MKSGDLILQFISIGQQDSNVFGEVYSAAFLLVLDSQLRLLLLKRLWKSIIMIQEEFTVVMAMDIIRDDLQWSV